MRGKFCEGKSSRGEISCGENFVREIVVRKNFRGRKVYPPALYPLFARVYSNFAEKVAYLHFLTLTLCTFDMGKSTKSYNTAQKKL